MGVEEGVVMAGPEGRDQSSLMTCTVRSLMWLASRDVSCINTSYVVHTTQMWITLNGMHGSVTAIHKTIALERA